MCLCWPGVQLDQIESTPNGKKVVKTITFGYTGVRARSHNALEKRRRSSRHPRKGSDEFSSSRSLHPKRKGSEEFYECPSSPEPPMQQIPTGPERYSGGLQYPSHLPARHAVPPPTPPAMPSRGSFGDQHAAPDIVDASPGWEIAPPAQMGIIRRGGIASHPPAPHHPGQSSGVLEGGGVVGYPLPRPPQPAPPSRMGPFEPGFNLGRQAPFGGPRIGLPPGVSMRSRPGARYGGVGRGRGDSGSSDEERRGGW
jgi:hypothetical protein